MKITIDDSELKKIADELIKTLGSMDAREADKVVASVATAIYRDVLKEDGEIIKKTDIFACGGVDTHIVEYTWKKHEN